jgi:hypothetical protein
MRAALYARKSQENEEAVEGQLAIARAFAAAKGFTVVRAFKDDGISGAEFIARPGFAALLAAVKATPRPFDVVITMNVDRVGREAYRTNMALLEIAEAGCRIFTYADGQEVKLEPMATERRLPRSCAGFNQAPFECRHHPASWNPPFRGVLSRISFGGAGCICAGHRQN